MLRPLAWLLVPALIASSGVASSLHTHAYRDHDHPEHHHGLAAHQHHPMAAPGDQDGVRLESCDPGEHAVGFTYLSSTPPHLTPAVSDAALTALPDASIRIHVRAAAEDVRIHGPPCCGPAPSRAPPLIARA